MSLPSIILRWVLPAAAGIACGSLLSPKGEHPVREDLPAAAAPADEVTALPDDPAMIQLAALAGRTTEALTRAKELVSTGASDADISEWLAPVLVSDPKCLEAFITGVPEERRINLVRAVLKKMGELHPDAVWEVIRVSPTAVAAAKAQGTDPLWEGIRSLYPAAESRLAVEILLDPAYGFPEEQVSGYLRATLANPDNARDLLERWIKGGWEPQRPDLLRDAYYVLHGRDHDALEALRTELDPGKSTAFGKYEASIKLNNFEQAPRTDYTVEELSTLGPTEIRGLAEEHAMSGAHLPLETIARLTPELREAALDSYFQWYYPFQADDARKVLADLGSLGFTEEEKQSLLENAFSSEWYEAGNFEQSLEVISMMKAGEGREKAERELLEDYANHDPAAALEFAKTMPEGGLRTKIEKLATDNLP